MSRMGASRAIYALTACCTLTRYPVMSPERNVITW